MTTTPDVDILIYPNRTGQHLIVLPDHAAITLNDRLFTLLLQLLSVFPHPISEEDIGPAIDNVSKYVYALRQRHCIFESGIVAGAHVGTTPGYRIHPDCHPIPVSINSIVSSYNPDLTKK